MLISEIIVLEADFNVDLCRSTLATILHEAEMFFCYIKRATSCHTQNTLGAQFSRRPRT